MTWAAVLGFAVVIAFSVWVVWFGADKEGE